jgi:hypothetical protein
LRQHHVARRDTQEGLGFPRVRGLGLRGHRRHPCPAHLGLQRGKGRGRRGTRRLRSELRPNLPGPGGGGAWRSSAGGGSGHIGAPPDGGTHQARGVRSTGARPVRGDPVRGERLRGAPRSGPGGCAGLDRALEEPGGASAARSLHPVHRGDRSQRRRSAHAPGQLQRDALELGDPARRHPRRPGRGSSTRAGASGSPAGEASGA